MIDSIPGTFSYATTPRSPDENLQEHPKTNEPAMVTDREPPAGATSGRSAEQVRGEFRRYAGLLSRENRNAFYCDAVGVLQDVGRDLTRRPLATNLDWAGHKIEFWTRVMADYGTDDLLLSDEVLEDLELVRNLLEQLSHCRKRQAEQAKRESRREARRSANEAANSAA